MENTGATQADANTRLCNVKQKFLHADDNNNHKADAAMITIPQLFFFFKKQTS